MRIGLHGIARFMKADYYTIEETLWFAQTEIVSHIGTKFRDS
jgi:hypothetical protein